MTDISGLPKGPASTGPVPEEQPTTGEPLTAEISGVDMLVYEGMDVLTSSTAFIELARKTIYEASVQNPELPPPDPDGASGPQPYGMAEQRMIKHKVAKELVERLKKSGLSAEEQKELYEAILAGKPIANPEQAKRAKSLTREVEDLVREEAHLPSSWTMTSTTPRDWIPEAIEPYDATKQKEIDATYPKAFDNALKSYASKQKPPLTTEQLDQIVNAFATGKVSSKIAEHFEAISKIATEEVQKTYGLPNTWFRGTTNVEDWKPINIGFMNTAAINQARAEFITDNVENQLKEINQAIQKVLDKLSPDDPAQIVGKEYQSIIAKAIRELKDLLREIQVRDAEKSRDVQKSRAGMTEARQKSVEDEIVKRKEVQEKQEKAERTSFIMKILGPAIGALATLIGAVLAIVTFGLATPLVVAGIAIGIALTAYSIVDSVTGCTGKLVSAFNNAVKSWFPENETLQKLVKFLIVAAVVVVLVIAAVLTGGGAAANVGSQAAAQVAKQAVLEAIKQLSIQLVVMTIMSSNAIPELIGAIMKANGVDKKTTQIWEMVIMALTMVITMIAVAKGMKPSGAAGAAEAGTTSTIATIKQIGSDIAAATTELIKRIKEGTEAAVQALIKLINDLIKQLESFVKAIPSAIKGVYDEVLASARSLLNTIQEGRTIESISAALTRFSTAMNEFGIATKTAAAAALEQALESALEVLKKAGAKTKESVEELGAAFAEIGRGWKKIGIQDIYYAIRGKSIPEPKVLEDMKLYQLFAAYRSLKNLENAGTIMSEQLRQLPVIEKALTEAGSLISTSTTKTLQLGAGMIETADGITQAVYGIQLYHLLLEVGETKKSQELLQAIIEQLNKLLQSMSAGMDSKMEEIKGLNQFLTNFIAGQSEIGSKMMRA